MGDMRTGVKARGSEEDLTPVQIRPLFWLLPGCKSEELQLHAESMRNAGFIIHGVGKVFYLRHLQQIY